MTPNRPLLRYYGGAWNKAPWVVSYFGHHRSYVETCAGAVSLLMHKPRAYRETVNDLNGRLTNFLEQVRDNADILAEKLTWTPWSELEFRKAWQLSVDPLEDARRFYCLCQMSITGGPDPLQVSKTFRIRTGPDGGDVTTSLTNVDHILAAADRLRGVQITHQSALTILAKFIKKTAPDMLIVHDPPFLEETRRHKAAYGIEPGKLADCDEDWHREAADLLNQHQGPAVVLGRPTALYEEIFENVGWERIDRTYQANSGSKQTESIWINPVLVGRQSVNFGLFAGASS